MISAEPAWWTADAWAARLASGNPVFPFEWAVHYLGGAVFQRVCQGRVRTSREAPLVGIRALRLTGPPLGTIELLAPPRPVTALVLRATVVGALGQLGTLGVARWTFGYETAAGLWGVVLDADGTLTHVTNGRGPG